MTRIQLLKFLDRILGGIACRLLPSGASRGRVSSIGKVLFIRPGGIGDAVLLIPAILNLESEYPGTVVHVLAEKRNAAVFSLCPEVREVFCYDKPGGITAALGKEYDAVIDTEQWHRLSAVVARMIGAPVTVGFATNERERLFSCPVPYSQEDYEVHSFFRLLEPLLPVKTDPAMTAPFLKLPPSAARKADELLGAFAHRRYVVIFPGASIPERRWGWRRYAVMAQKLSEQGVPVVVVGGEGDRLDGEAIVAHTQGLNLAGEIALAETAAIISKGAVLVSGDSGVLHIGVGLGRPTVSLFGPGIRKKWAPRGDDHIVIDKSLPCSPCTKFGHTLECSVNSRCLSQITVEEVLEAVESLLDRR